MKVFNAIDVNHDKFLDKKALCPEYPVASFFSVSCVSPSSVAAGCVLTLLLVGNGRSGRDHG